MPLKVVQSSGQSQGHLKHTALWEVLGEECNVLTNDGGLTDAGHHGSNKHVAGDLLLI